jgi:hypothetical protein
MRCAACGQATLHELCYFCTRTVELVKARRCVSCTQPVTDADFPNVQGKCLDCLARNHRLSSGTRWVLRQASKARYALKAVA